MPIRRIRHASATAAVAMAASAVLLACSALAPSSSLAASTPPTPPTVTSAFTPATIAVTGTSALSITITNPSTTATLSGIGFSDTLPAGLIIDDPNGQNGSCGSAGILTATPSTNVVTLTAGKLAPSTSCTVSTDVTASTAGAYSNSTGPISFTGGSTGGSGDTESLTVVGLPTVTIAAPGPYAIFKFGQKVKARYSCEEATGGPGISSCTGDVAVGAPLDTSVAGVQTFTVTATSLDGTVQTDAVQYTVLPDNVFTVSQLKARKGGALGFHVELPGRGELEARATVGGFHGRFSLGHMSLHARGAGALDVVITPTAAASRHLAAALAAGKAGRLRARIVVHFKPKGGKIGSLTLRGVRVLA